LPPIRGIRSQAGGQKLKSGGRAKVAVQAGTHPQKGNNTNEIPHLTVLDQFFYAYFTPFFENHRSRMIICPLQLFSKSTFPLFGYKYLF
jgi:hypothetical protein